MIFPSISSVVFFVKRAVSLQSGQKIILTTTMNGLQALRLTPEEIRIIEGVDK